MAFVYRFFKFLEHRRLQRREAQVALARAVEQAFRVDRLLADTEKALENCRQRWEQRTSEGLPVGEHLAFERYLAELEQRLQELKKAREHAWLVVQEKQKRLMEQDQEVKKLERLQEVDYDRYRRDQKKREQKELDEYGTRLDLDPFVRDLL
ncbi:flagellar export protein FliJ [Desulfosoma caldarium]|uniref:Flagellar FliJ protein n=1 Tax=Desulfosoma caldarium TaxID=610254 RepID=A0A3N1VGB0_9BACT|nr:flagellar export protein FliJ [Desulfosoma caldarium]ROR01874.1 flagellar FliJ protein [Desulfosoma caldarium]